MTAQVVINNCKASKSEELLISNLGIDEQPDLSQFSWVERLDLSKNNLKKINKSLLPPNLKILCLNQNKITSISHLDIPESIEILFVSVNQIKHFDGVEFQNLKKLDISVNCLETFTFPPNVEKVNISANTLEKIGEFPESLTKLLCHDNMLTDFSYINNKLICINIANNKFSELPPFPDTIEYIICEDNYISQLWYIPENVKVFNIKNNRLKNLYLESICLPKCIEIIDFSDNMLSEMPSLPEGIKEVYFSGNRIEELVKIPLSVKILDVSDNCLSRIPEELKKRDMKFKYDNNLIHDDSDTDLYRSTSPDDTIFGNMFDMPPKKQEKDILDYFRGQKDNQSPPQTKEPIVTYYSGYNSHMLGTSAYNSPPKPKYIYIVHKKKVIL